MYYLMEFACEEAIDIVHENQLVMDEKEPLIGDKVQVEYKLKGKNKTGLYLGEVLLIADDRQHLENELSIRVSKDSDDESALGRGHRLRRKKFEASEEKEEEETTEQKKLKKAQPAQKLKQNQQKETAKRLAHELKILKKEVPVAETNPGDEKQKEIENLQAEVKRLTSDNKRLRKERKDAQDLTELLGKADELVKQLEKTIKPFKPQNINIIPVQLPPPQQSSCQPAAIPVVATTSKDTSYLNLPSTSPRPVSPRPSTGFEMPQFFEMENEEAQLEMVETPTDFEERLAEPPKEQQLLYNGSEEGVCRLVQEKDIYVLTTAKVGLEQMAKNPTTLVRSGLRAVFKDSALYTCSVKGGAARGPLGKPDEKRDGLHPVAIAALIEFAKNVSKAKGWREPTTKELVSAMGTKLSEMRKIAARMTT